MARKRCSSIGGQAVLEGVMMRGKSCMATAVRNPKGEIVVESSRFVPIEKKSKFYKIPIIRGIVSFVSSMIMGIKTLNRSSEVFGELDQEEPSKFEKWIAKKFNIDIMNVLIFVSLIIGVALALGLFVFLPHLATQGIMNLSSVVKNNTILVNLIAGIIRIIIFIIYILLISRMKDIKRLFMYHGAEHKVISCYENALDLTVENAQKMSTRHDRCGTTFIIIIMVFSIIFFSFDVFSQNIWQRILIRIAFIPLVAGISYELLKLFAKFDNWFTRICKAPGLLFQKLTTNEPTDDMIEVSIKAFTTVMELEEDPNKEVESFVTFSTIEKAKNEMKLILDRENEIEIILMNVLGCKKVSEIYDGRRISSEQKNKAAQYAKKRKKGAPLQYILGDTCFYGIDFNVDQRALIPRFDTENLVKAAIDIAEKMENPKILDLMTGSGAIAIAIKKNVNCQMVATDISAEAISLAKENSEKNECDIDFRIGSLFRPVKDDKFDIICSNPPYIPTNEIKELDKEINEYEPLIALDGGIDGLDFYRDIIGKADKYLKENGYLIFEIGINQNNFVKEILGNKYEIESIFDLNNPPIERVIIAKLIKKDIE